MANKILIKSISVSGFRAYLTEKDIPVQINSKRRSLAIFAPNAKGKSSLVDAIEFFFSPDGSIKRLGKQKSGTQAGPEALQNDRAADTNIDSYVAMSFVSPNKQSSGKRQLSDVKTNIPNAAKYVLENQSADPIIRGHELRQFVEGQTPQERYEQVSKWFKFAELSNFGSNIRKLRMRVQKDKTIDNSEKERIKDLKRCTEDALTKWDPKSALDWINNEIISPLDSKLHLTELSKNDPAYSKIEERKAAEQAETGVPLIKQLISALTTLHNIEAEPTEGDHSKKTITADTKSNDHSTEATPATETIETGAIFTFEASIQELAVKLKTEQEERSKAEKAVFRSVWESASEIFSNESTQIEACPICETPFPSSPHGSRAGIIQHLAIELKSIDAYRTASAELSAARASAQAALTTLKEKTERAQEAIASSGMTGELIQLTEYASEIQDFVLESAQPAADSVREIITKTLQQATTELTKAQSAQDEITYSHALTKVDQMLTLKGQLDCIANEKHQFSLLTSALQEQEDFFRNEAGERIESVLLTLQNEIRNFYESIQSGPGKTPDVILNLDAKSKQAQLHLKIDFSETRKGVNPAGYLSDSQIHTLALSIRLAAAKLLNTAAPFIVLDDVVTSYDAEHRKSIARTLATHLPGFQIILVTHDEMFFKLVKEHVSDAEWSFRRIIRLDPDHGPEMDNDRGNDDEIAELLAKDQDAGNLIRKAEEEWLLTIARDFKVLVSMRSVSAPYEFSRSELASALASLLKKLKIQPPKIEGILNPFLNTLTSGTMENFESHYSDNPNMTGSVGDQRERWKEFLFFRGLFVCPRDGCDSTRFKNPLEVKQPICAKCSQPFAFHNPDEDEEVH